MAKCSIFACSSWCYQAPMRHVVATILFFGVLVAYTHRVVVNVAIVEMVSAPKKSVKGTECPLPEGQKSSLVKGMKDQRFDWDEGLQGHMLSAFFIGYVIPQFPSGYICDRWGSRWPLLIGFIISTIATLISPLVANHMHHWFFFGLRVVCGLSQACFFPAVTTMMSRWIPPAERTTIGGAVFCANSIGVIIGNMGTGIMIAFLRSWAIVYYAWGLVGAIYSIAFAMYVYSVPTSHPHLDPEELELIEAAITPSKKHALPCKAIAKDPVLYGLIFGHIGHNYLTFALISNLPKYMNNVLQYDMKANAFTSSLPFFGMYFSSVLTGKLADWMIKKKNIKVSLVRVSYTFVGNVLPGAFCVAAGYAGCDRFMALTMFTLALLCKGMFYSGLKVNVMDVTKHHSGMVMSIVNGLGSITGYAAPRIIGKIANKNLLSQWYTVFWIQFGITFITFFVYMFTATGKRCKWDYTEEELAALPTDVPKPEKWYLEK